ncbi:MAG: SWIB/MDM2 domain-containing protein [candidate division Zixibacteria bacterium]|nr:SWIB/MDM2 domain-containing protein [candidate division Zixibacteria bacterium]
MAVAKKATKKAAKKSGAKKSTARKATVKKSPARKATAKKSPVRKAAPRKAVAKKAAKPKVKRKPNAAFMRPMSLSPELGAVVGNSPIPRTEVTRKLWAYIKSNKLQDNVNRRMINADDKLKQIFGGKTKVSMFEMTKLVSKHLK